MIYVRTIDTGEIEKYESLQEVYQNCEAWDVYGGEYEFFDEDNNKLEIMWIKEFKKHKILWFFETYDEGRYKLVCKQKEN